MSATVQEHRVLAGWVTTPRRRPNDANMFIFMAFAVKCNSCGATLNNDLTFPTYAAGFAISLESMVVTVHRVRPRLARRRCSVSVHPARTAAARSAISSGVGTNARWFRLASIAVGPGAAPVSRTASISGIPPRTRQAASTVVMRAVSSSMCATIVSPKIEGARSSKSPAGRIPATAPVQCYGIGHGWSPVLWWCFEMKHMPRDRMNSLFIVLLDRMAAVSSSSNVIPPCCSRSIQYSGGWQWTW